MNRPNAATDFKLVVPRSYIQSSDRFVRDSFEEVVEEVFSSFFRDTQSFKDKVISKGQYPKTDIIISENKKTGAKKMIMEIAVPGIEPDNINIDAHFLEGTLTVKYEKQKYPVNEEVTTYFTQREMTHLGFMRVFSIPLDILKFEKNEDIKINMKNGILTIEIDFLEEKKKPVPENNYVRLPINVN